MDKNYFDKLIKDKLEHLEAGFSPSDWEAFEDMLDQNAGDLPEKTVEEVEASLIAKLDRIEVPYNEAHWTLMEEQLNSQSASANQTIRFKLAELSLLLLLLLTFYQYLPVSQQPLTNPDTAKTQVEQSVASATAESTERDLNSENIPGTEPQEPRAVTSSASTKETPSGNEPKVEKQAIQSPSSAQVPPTSSKSNSQPTAQEPDQAAVVLAEEIGLDETVAEGSELNKTNGKTSESLSPQDEKEAASTLDLLMEQLPVITPSLSEKEPSKELNTPEIAAIIPPATRLYLGMFGAADINYIMTPYNPDFQDDAYAQAAMGYSGGVSLSASLKNRLGVELALLYSSKTYLPKPRVEIFDGSLSGGGYFTDRLLGVQHDMIVVPLHVRYDFVKKGKFKAYGLAGGSMHLVTQSYYDIQTTFEPTQESNNFFPMPIPGGGNLPPSLPSPEKESTISQSISSDGFFNGGTFSKNTYYTLNAGLGIEYSIKENYNLFLQPTYFHSLSSEELGPNSDRINNFSIWFGARVQIR